MIMAKWGRSGSLVINIKGQPFQKVKIAFSDLNKLIRIKELYGI